MEIKQGDKVRVSKDAPRIYTPDWVDAMFDLVLKVTEVEDGNAMVKFAKRTQYRTVLTAIPCKYLVKVDAEAKEAKFKVGDKVVRKNASTVRTIISIDYVDDDEDPTYYYNTVDSQGNNPMDFLESELILYIESTPKYKKGDRVKICSKNADRFGFVGTILEVHDNGTVDVDFNDYYVGGHLYNVDFIEPYIEPSAPKIKIGDRVRCKNPLRLANSTDNDFIGIVTDAVTDGENGWFNVRMNNGATFQTYHESDLELIYPTEQTEAEKKPNIGSIKIPVEVDLTDGYWDAYAAYLAKEIVLKTVNSASDRRPMAIAEYATDIAKAVVEGLKRK